MPAREADPSARESADSSRTDTDTGPTRADGDPARAEALGIRAALARHAAGEPPTTDPGSWAPVGPDMADEVAWLSRVSAEFRRLRE